MNFPRPEICAGVEMPTTQYDDFQTVFALYVSDPVSLLFPLNEERRVIAV